MTRSPVFRRPEKRGAIALFALFATLGLAAPATPSQAKPPSFMMVRRGGPMMEMKVHFQPRARANVTVSYGRAWRVGLAGGDPGPSPARAMRVA